MDRLKKALFLSLLVNVASSAADPTSRVSYAFEIGIDPSLAYAKNITYQYGELAASLKPFAKPIGAPFELSRLEMTVPEQFTVSWQTPDSITHSSTIPVRSSLRGSIRGKALLFLISYSELHGYVVVNTPTGQKREQFY